MNTKVMQSLLGAGLVVALVGAVAPTGHAEPGADRAEIDSVAEADVGAGRVTGVTVGSARNQATGDVLGLGYEQVIRIEGSTVVVAEPTYRGGAVLRQFEARVNTTWLKWRTPLGYDSQPYYGQYNLEDIVKHQASRIAVLGGDIFVSRLYESRYINGGPRWDTIVEKYDVDGTLQTERIYEAHAITALDAYEFQGQGYLAMGLNKDGVRIAKADAPGLPDYRAVHEDWTGREFAFQGPKRDQVTVVKLGTDGTGRLMLIAGKITYGHPAIVATDLRAGTPGGGAGVYMWTNNERPFDAPDLNWQFPDLVDFGALDPSGRPAIAISWPSLGRVSFLDAASGADWTWVDRGVGAHAIRFFTDRDGKGFVAIARDSQNGSESYTISAASSRGELVTVREGRKDDLPKVLAELTAP